MVLSLLATQAATLTAGLKWPPETWPTAVTMVPMASPWARATVTSPAPGVIPVIWFPAATMDPAPMKIRAKVPTNSASSLRGMLPPFRVAPLVPGRARGVKRRPFCPLGIPGPKCQNPWVSDVRASGLGLGGGVTRAHPAAFYAGPAGADGLLWCGWLGRVAPRESARL